ncbi:hypothetical protein HPB51_019340 [Rhipicephalus microplus]|uniref:Uncharacterized protein n=1 Tax=Rhipicephalus microplus TaxID=6941 RepID=A0A9J6D6V6_RHIMP|nr:hypothetical protein HPB51_019340 [Rhipicephalus microplus]
MMDKDGLHYNNTGVRFVARKISTVAQVFLEQRHSDDRQPRLQTPRRRHWKSPRRSRDNWTMSKDGDAHPTATAGQLQHTPPHPMTLQHPSPLPGLPAWAQTPTFPWNIPNPPKYHVSHCRGAGAPSPRDGHEGTPMRRRRPPRRHTHTPGVNVGFLNLHGARRMSKWEALFQTTQAEDFPLFAVAETHLRALEEPPPNAE